MLRLTLMLIKLTPHSLATALARSVLPVPGAPYRSRADLKRMGQCENNSGY